MVMNISISFELPLVTIECVLVIASSSGALGEDRTSELFGEACRGGKSSNVNNAGAVFFGKGED